MRRSRRLSGLPADVIPGGLEHTRAPAKKSLKKSSKKKTSSKKENVRPSRSARRPAQSPTRTKRKVPATAKPPTRSKKRSGSRQDRSSTPKKTPARSAKRTTPKRATPKRATPKRSTPKRTAVTPKRTKTPKRKASAKKAAKSSIHRKTPRRTPARSTTSRRKAKQELLSDTDDEEETKQQEEGNAVPRQTVADFVAKTKADDDDDSDYSPETDEDAGSEYSTGEPNKGHSMDLMIVGMVICLLALYMFSFCRAMSCSAITNLPVLSDFLADFDFGATVVTSFLVYVVGLWYCRSWLKGDGYSPEGEAAFVTLHFFHGLLLAVHVVSCAMADANDKKVNCIESIVGLSMGFYWAAWVMQLKFSIYFLRNSLSLCYICSFYYYQKNAFGLVLLLACKSVFWMIGSHVIEMMNDRWALVDMVVSVGCVFLAYVVPTEI